jgi:hypothetical protein
MLAQQPCNVGGVPLLWVQRLLAQVTAWTRSVLTHVLAAALEHKGRPMIAQELEQLNQGSRGELGLIRATRHQLQ